MSFVFRSEGVFSDSLINFPSLETPVQIIFKTLRKVKEKYNIMITLLCLPVFLIAPEGDSFNPYCVMKPNTNKFVVKCKYNFKYIFIDCFL